MTASVVEFLQRRLKVRHLRLILTLHDARSISGAAERLCISQAAVSKARAEIEDLLGMPLFNRSVGRWEPTAMGQQLISAARRIMAELDCLNSEFRLIKDGLLGTVTVGTRTTALLPFIAQATAAFKQLYPRVTISLVDGPLSRLLEQMKKGEVDLVVAPLGEARDSAGFANIVLRRERHVVIASPNHEFVGRDGVTWAQAVQQPWCMPPVGTRTRSHLHSFLARKALPFPSNLVEANSLLMMIALMQETPLLTLVPMGIVPQLKRQELARLLPLPVDGARDPVHLVWQDGLPLPPATRLFRDFLLAQIRRSAKNGDAPANGAADAMTRSGASDRRRASTGKRLAVLE
ncbi:DNA-binding transcriptional regulator, LysR family [Rhizobiales bacterium GAS191]|nr:DNA-binding transcriptional regulator, LysR family [Rhizobiales bacterium GAS191]